MPSILTVNIGRLAPNPFKDRLDTGIGKRPVGGPVEVRAPGPKDGGLGSGLVGDSIGDRKNHGGDDQAVYAYAREDLDDWERTLGRELPNGMFGENLTTTGIDVTGARLGEVWRIGDGGAGGRGCTLRLRCPRIPCATFLGAMGIRGWLKTFTRSGRSGAYFSVVTPGTVEASDPVEVVHRPEHDVTIERCFLALTLEPDFLPSLLRAGDDLTAGIAERARTREAYVLDE